MLLRFVIVLLAAVSFSLSQNTGLRVEGAWVRLVPNKTTAAYMVLVNGGARPLRVLGVSSPAAARGEMHQTVTVDPNDHLGMDHGHSPEMRGMEVTGMRQVRELVVPARGRLELKPGGTHIMLIDLRQPLRAGGRVRLALRLEGGQTLNVDAVVRAQ